MEEIKYDANMLKDKYLQMKTGLLEMKYLINQMIEDMDHPNPLYALRRIRSILYLCKDLVRLQRAALNTLEQETLNKSIEVTGLPEEYAKDIKGVAEILSHILGIPILESYIAAFERVGEMIENGPPRPLVVHLHDENIKRRILIVADTVVLSVVRSDIPMQIMEHLTPYNKELLKSAREEALKQQINNVWVENGRIYYKWNENSIIYEIETEEDIERMSEL